MWEVCLKQNNIGHLGTCSHPKMEYDYPETLVGSFGHGITLLKEKDTVRISTLCKLSAAK